MNSGALGLVFFFSGLGRLVCLSPGLVEEKAEEAGRTRSARWFRPGLFTSLGWAGRLGKVNQGLCCGPSLVNFGPNLDFGKLEFCGLGLCLEPSSGDERARRP